MNILIKFPTRNRPDKFIQTFLKYQYMKSGLHDVRFLVSMDVDDETMNCDRIRGFLSKHTNVTKFYGESRTKVQAINADLEKNTFDFDILLNASDDMIPVSPNYDDIIATDMMKNFPDLDGVLHYNDGRVGEILNTFCIMGRKYFDRFKYIYNPVYTSVFCDNEFTDVSRMLGKAKYFDRVLFHHGWAQYVGMDALMIRNENKEIYKIDSQIYHKRKQENFV